jgi:hypothetical protein
VSHSVPIVFNSEVTGAVFDIASPTLSAWNLSYRRGEWAKKTEESLAECVSLNKEEWLSVL